MKQERYETRTIEEIGERYSLSEFLHEVVRRQETVTVVLEEDDAVVVKPITQLTPLPGLEGSVPSGWKDGIY